MPLPLLADEQFLSGLLTAVKDKALALLGTEAPPRSFVSAGEPAFDCDQLSVHLARLGPSLHLNSQQSDPRGSKQVATVATIVLTVLKCVSTQSNEGKLPGSVALDSEGRALTDIAQALWFGLLAASQDGTLFPAQVRPAVLFRGIDQFTPQAGLAGLKATWEVSLT